MSRGRPPVVHLALLAVVGFAFLVGGQITFTDWGSLSVRPLAAYLALAVTLHAASVFAPRGGTPLRGLAWLILAAMPLHLQVLLRPQVIVPVLALGIVDVVRYRTQTDEEDRVPASAQAKAVAGLATLALVGVLAVLVPLAKSVGILVRLGLVATVGWALIVGFALRSSTREPVTLLAAAGAFAATFGLLAGPVVPLGPLTTYWVGVLAVAAAVLTAVFSASRDDLPEGARVHEQTVRSLPDPLLAPLADRVREAIETGRRMPDLARRIEEASGAGEGALEERVEALREQGVDERRARRRAMAELLNVDLDEGGVRT